MSEGLIGGVSGGVRGGVPGVLKATHSGEQVIQILANEPDTVEKDTSPEID